MERRIPMSRWWLGHLAVVVLGLFGEPALAGRSVVLVTGENCPLEFLSMMDIRKAYLSLPVTRQGHVIRPYRLRGNSELNDIFLQTVVAMSKRSYERRLVSLALKYGQPRPAELADTASLVRMLRLVDCGIGYIWQVDLDAYEGLKILRPLWQGE